MTNSVLPWRRTQRLNSRRTVPAFECVYLTSSEYDFRNASLSLGAAGILLHRAAILEQAEFLLGVTGAGVLLSELEFLDGNWRDAKGMLSQCHPEAALLVSVSQADERILTEVLERGGHGVILKPFRADDLRCTLATAQIRAKSGAAHLSAGA